MKALWTLTDLVSVVLPFRNEARWLGKALASLKRQTHQSFEAVLVNDGSTDCSGEVASAFSREDRRFRLIPSAGQGLVDALNTGLEVSLGEWVARFDADDLCHPERLGLQLELARKTGRKSVISCLVRCFPRDSLTSGYIRYEKWLNSLVRHDQIARDIFVESPVPHPGVLFHRKTVIEAGGYRDLGLPEDYELWLRLWSRGFVFEKVPRHLIAWRERPDRFSRSNSAYSLSAFYRTKAMYLAKLPFLSEKHVVFAGSGQTARRLSGYMLKEGFRIEAFLSPGRPHAGATMRGRPVVDSEALGQFPGLPVIAASREPGARERVRLFLTARGLREGCDFVVCA